MNVKNLSVGGIKKREDIFEVLRPYMDAAMSLYKINRNKLPSKSAPGTKVYELIEKLKPCLK